MFTVLTFNPQQLLKFDLKLIKTSWNWKQKRAGHPEIYTRHKSGIMIMLQHGTSTGGSEAVMFGPKPAMDFTTVLT